MSLSAGITAAPDGQRVAVWGADRFCVVDLASFASRELPIADASSAVFLDDDLLIASPADAATRLRALAPEDLEPRGDELVPGSALLSPGHGDHAVLLEGGKASLLRARPLRHTPVLGGAAASAIDRVLPIDHGQYLVCTGDRTGTWNPAHPETLAAAVVRLPAEMIAADVCAQRRSIWTLTRGGAVDVRRLADGRVQPIALPGPATAVWSHPLSAWLIVRIGDALHRVHAALGQCEPLAIELARAQALVVDGVRALLVQDGDEGVSVVEIASTAPTRPDDRRAPPRRPDADPGGQSWSEATDLLTSTPPARTAQRPPTPAPPSGAPEPAGAEQDWRRRLVEWAARALGGSSDRPPETPIDRLAAELGLGPIAVRLLAILYGRWLAGEGFVGIAAAKLVAVTPPPSEATWAEVLGTGSLAAHGLVLCRGGRLRLTRTATDRLAGSNPVTFT